MSEDEATAANALLESVRKTMVKVIVVNGLKDVKLGREFMAKNDFDWDKPLLNLVWSWNCRRIRPKAQLPSPPGQNPSPISSYKAGSSGG